MTADYAICQNTINNNNNYVLYDIYKMYMYIEYMYIESMYILKKTI